MGDMSLNIGVVIHSIHGGGAERVARQWIDALQAGGHDVFLYTYHEHDGAPPTVTHRTFTGRTVLSRWTSLPRWLRAQVRADNIDVVVAVLDFSNLIAVSACWGSKVPVIISEHSVPSILWRQKGPGGVVKRRLARLLYRRGASAIAVSHAVAADLAGGLGVSTERIHVLPNPVSETPERAKSRPPSQGRRVLLVGRCSPEKNFSTAIEATRLLRERGEDIRLLVIGDGPTRSSLEAQAQRSKVPAEFTGWVSDWREYIGTDDVLVLPSTVEGFGNVLVEAAAAGVPSVASSTALGVADAMIPGVTGILATSTSPQDLAVAIAAARRLDVRGTTPAGWLARFGARSTGAELNEIVLRSVTGAPQRRRVTHVGAHPDSAGGIASVIRNYRTTGQDLWELGFLRSYKQESKLFSAPDFMLAALKVSTAPAETLGLVHVHVSQGGSFLREGLLARLAHRRGIPTVATVHGSSFLRFRDRHPRLVSRVLRHFDGIALLAESHRDALPLHLQQRTEIIPNPVLVSSASQPLRPTPRAVFAGELSHRKGIDTLLAAWPRVNEAIPNAQLVVIGTPQTSLPQAVPGVQFLGQQPNEIVQQQISEAWVAVLPSRDEALPVFILESMALGRAVIGTPVGGVPGLLERGGLLVPPGDVGALTDALIELLRDPGRTEQLGAEARSHYDHRYSLDVALNSLDALYDRAAAAQGAS